MSPSGFSGPLVPAINIVVLGESGVGKSSIVDKFLFNAQWVRYDAVGTSPFGTESTSDRFNVEVDGQQYFLLFNDINATPIRLQQPGLVHSFQDKSLNVADGVLLLYDIGDVQSFDHIIQWGWEYACACRTGV
jgi:GTPase SAR1 family protein